MTKGRAIQGCIDEIVECFGNIFTNKDASFLRFIIGDQSQGNKGIGQNEQIKQDDNIDDDHEIKQEQELGKIVFTNVRRFRQDLYVYLSRASFGSEVIIRLGDGQELVLSKKH